MSGLWKCGWFETEARSNGTAYRIFVGEPATPFLGGAAENGERRFPVIFVLDAKLNFAAVHAQVQIMSAMRQLPPAYVIGVGYAGDESFFEKDGFLRQADLTPNAGGEIEADVKAMNRAHGVTLGGADLFLDFLRDELRPALEAAFPVDPDDATLLGNSLGGLFPSWVLFHAPALFRRYVIVSPSWWWNDYEVWRWEEDYAASHRDLPARVFVAFGGLETADRHRAIAVEAMALADGAAKEALARTVERSDTRGWVRGAELVPEFRERLSARRYPGLELTALVLPDETHESVSHAAFSRGAARRVRQLAAGRLNASPPIDLQGASS